MQTALGLVYPINFIGTIMSFLRRYKKQIIKFKYLLNNSENVEKKSEQTLKGNEFHLINNSNLLL